MGPAPTETFVRELEALLARGPDTHPSDLFRGVSDELWLWVNTEGRDGAPALRELLPGLPDEAQQRLWTGKSGRDTQAEGFTIYRTIRDLYARHIGDLRDAGPVLDFGCGWGRVIRYFLRDVEPGHLLGTDHDMPNVEFCRRSNPWCSFTRNDAEPPLPFDDGSVGYVYAYSVFSHFSEPMHLAWLTELRRILRPGGALAVTVRPRTFIEHSRRLREQGATSITARMFPDTEAALDRYDRGGFCFSPYRTADEGAWWGEACIPRPYVEEQWSRLFDVVEFDTTSLKQHLVLLRA